MVIKPHKYSKALELYCYLRYIKATTREARLFWLNAHYLAGGNKQ